MNDDGVNAKNYSQCPFVLATVGFFTLLPVSRLGTGTLGGTLGRSLVMARRGPMRLQTSFSLAT